MLRIFVHLSFFLFMLTALSGTYMRALPFFPDMPVPYTNMLHAHSHVAILGWAFLGVFIIFLTIGWPVIKRKTYATLITCTILLVSLVMFAAFLYQGYGLYSIIISTIHIFIEYWAAIFIWQQLRKREEFATTGRLFIKGSLVALVISSLGPFSLGFIAANGLKDSFLFDMAIYFYLHFQYNGWLFLVLIGLFIFILQRKGIRTQTWVLKTGFWLYFISLFPGYLLSVLWVDLGRWSWILASIGSIGQWVAVILILMALLRTWTSLQSRIAQLTRVALAITWTLLFCKSTMELGLMVPGLAETVYNTRHVIIGYLHLTLLGFVSIFILTQYQLTGLLNGRRETNKLGFFLFLIGFILNEGVLFLLGLFAWLQWPTIPYSSNALFAAALFLVVGISIIWRSVLRKTEQA
ncbi:MAG TPA: hypothetical protein VK136_10685 [Bacillota bacterium]|nr:hypothetical protein [Bacillota bacterium]